jgi:hypothetical protein
MPYPDSNTRARAELVDDRITTEYLWKRKTLGCVTEAELWEYEDWRDRICQLYAELIDRATAAYLAPAARRKSRNDQLSDPRVVCCNILGGRQSAESPPQSLIAGQ